jgi:hypothetical protein
MIVRPIDADELLVRPIPNRGRPDEEKSKTWNFYYGFACALQAVGDVVREMPECGPKMDGEGMDDNGKNA